MLYADILNDLLGNACLAFVVIVALIGYALQGLGKAVGSFFQNETVQDITKSVAEEIAEDITEDVAEGFLDWWFNDD